MPCAHFENRYGNKDDQKQRRHSNLTYDEAHGGQGSCRVHILKIETDKDDQKQRRHSNLTYDEAHGGQGSCRVHISKIETDKDDQKQRRHSNFTYDEAHGGHGSCRMHISKIETEIKMTQSKDNIQISPMMRHMAAMAHSAFTFRK
jgi:hypothetical protein